MNGYLIFALALLIFDYVLKLVVERLNLRELQTELPEDFRGVYDAEKYVKSQHYLREKTLSGLMENTIMLSLTIGFILLGGFRLVDSVARSAGHGMIVTGLIFAATLVGLSLVVGLPFKMYDIFVIEARYGFNKTTPVTFIGDLVKQILLGVVLGGVILAGILWFFTNAGPLAWLYAWGALAGFQLVLMYIAPVVILPLFNKFTPLEDGELRQAIEKYAASQQVALAGIFTMDGSKRSTKSNAFFTGFGKTKRIALFDTLIANHFTEELVGVLAHEIGHAKLGHIKTFVVVSLASSLLMLWMLSCFIADPKLYEAFGVSFGPIDGHTPIYAGLAFFGFLYAPIAMVLGLLGNILSRKHEFEADAFAAKTTNAADTMIRALKKLSVDNLSNLTPHPLKVFLEYSHPPVLARIAALRPRHLSPPVRTG